MIYINDILRDAQIDKLIADCDTVHLVDGETSDYATAIASSLGSFTPTITKGDYAGAGGGRAATIAAKADIDITTLGNLDNYVFVDTSTSTVLQVNPSQGKSYEVGDKAELPEAIIFVAPDAVAL